MTDEDKELLRMAAKAGGIEIKSFEYGSPLLSISLGCPAFWNPLSNCNDAFRLMTKLQLRFESTDDYMVCYAGTVMAEQFTERVINGDRDAAARRAITRAAAHIGSKLT
jgi:hypothetical protein